MASSTFRSNAERPRSGMSLPPPKPLRREPPAASPESFASSPSSASGEKPPSLSAKTFPSIRLSEDSQHVTIVAVVPGFSHEDLDVAVENDVLRITGRLRQQVPQNLPCVKKERLGGDFSRSIKLASDVLRSHTEARLENGVLTVKMRKCGPADRIAIPFRQP